MYGNNKILNYYLQKKKKYNSGKLEMIVCLSNTNFKKDSGQWRFTNGSIM